MSADQDATFFAHVKALADRLGDRKDLQGAEINVGTLRADRTVYVAACALVLDRRGRGAGSTATVPMMRRARHAR